VQLPSYNLGKKVLTSWGWKDNSCMTYFVASGLSGLCVVSDFELVCCSRLINPQCVAMQ
jgi:hypothetical protein